MQKFSDALFTMIASIVGAATQEPEGYPVRLVEALKGSFGRILGLGDKLIEKIGGLGA